MLPASSTLLQPKYLLLDLKNGGSTITLAISRQDLYVMGYADKVESNDRAHFFKDASSDTKKDLFPNAKAPYRLEISYKSSYQEIGSKAGVKDRKNFGLGVQKLASRVGKVYGADVKGKAFVKTEAEMLLLAVQMVCEAARFSYIEEKVKSNYDEVEFIPDYKLIGLEGKWDKLSTAIRGADPKTKQFKGSVDLVHPDNTNYTVNNVDQVKNDIALLNYVK